MRAHARPRPLTLTEVANLPAVIDLFTAGQALGLGRTKSYELARAGQIPCPATLMLAAGHDMKVVQEILGLSSITIAADTCTSVLPRASPPVRRRRRRPHSSRRVRLTRLTGMCICACICNRHITDDYVNHIYPGIGVERKGLLPETVKAFVSDLENLVGKHAEF